MKKYILIIIVSFLIYNYFQISSPLIVKLDLENKKLNKEVKITQISDFHNNRYLREDRLLRDVAKFNPDIIVLTGDIIDMNTEDWTVSLNLLEEIHKICEDIYFVSGNHEERNKGHFAFLSDLKAIGINIMDNRLEKLNIGENKIGLVGVEYYYREDEYRDLISGLDESSFNILLSHSPDRIVPNLTGREDLVLSGHTHGGQVRFPFLGGLIAPGQGFLPEYDKGLYEIGRTTLYIDSGLGNSFLPLRFLNRIQVTNIRVDK